MTDDNEESRYASRKWILAMLIVVAAILLLLGEFIKEVAFVDLVKWVAGLYFGFNVTQKGFEWLAGVLADMKKKGGAE
ncbi:hypothetical protein LJR175_003116 [Variovorax sp. LjRoot175]|uniref:hypothetical protein n=1 Tax=Variovorax sp. LjRoot175 TaxID=3342276 RepID=UPI003ECD427A